MILSFKNAVNCIFFLMKAIVKICMWAAVFVLVVWVLMDIGPSETYERVRTRLTSFKNGTVSFLVNFGNTAGQMKKVADYHLEEADNRTKGIDPYQNYDPQSNKGQYNFIRY